MWNEFLGCKTAQQVFTNEDTRRFRVIESDLILARMDIDVQFIRCGFFSYLSFGILGYKIIKGDREIFYRFEILKMPRFRFDRAVIVKIIKSTMKIPTIALNTL